MISNAFKKYAAALGMTVDKSDAYGVVDGYMMTFYEGMGYKSVHVAYALVGDAAAANRQLVQEFVAARVKEFKLAGFKLDEQGLLVNFTDVRGVMERIQLFLPPLTGRFHELQIPGAQCCSYCGQPLADGGRVIRENDRVLVCDNACCERKTSPDAVPTAALEAELIDPSMHYGRGTAGAILGMLVGILPWILVGYFGYFVGYLGLLIGIAAKFGYEKLGGKIGRGKIWIVAVTSLAGVVLAQFITACIQIAVELKDSLGITLGPIDLVQFTGAYIAEYSDAAAIFYGNLAIGFLFAILGLWGVIKSMRQEHREVHKQFEVLR